MSKIALREGIRQGREEGVIRSASAFAGVALGLACLHVSFGLTKFGLEHIASSLAGVMCYLG